MSSGKRNPPEALDDDGDEDDPYNDDDEINPDRDDSRRVWFYPMPVGKLVIFGLIGSTWFCGYWMYRCWRAYRDAWGYLLARGFRTRVPAGWRVEDTRVREAS